MLGYTTSELLKLDINDLIDAEHPESLLILEEREKTCHAQGEMIFKRKDGSHIICEVSSVIFTSAHGQKLASTTLKDITALKKTQKDLEVSDEWLDFAQKAARSGFWDWDMHTGELTWSDELYELFGIPLSEPPSFDIWLERMHPQDRDPAMNTINHSIEEHIPLENEYRMIKPDGTEIWISAIGETYYDSENNPYRMSGLCLDITSIKESELSRKESEERYRSLFDNMLNGFAYCKMIFKDDIPEDFIYIDVNDSFEKLTGLNDVNGKKVSEIIPGIKESDPQIFEIYGRVAITGNPESFEIFLESLEEWFSISVYSPRQEYFVAVFDVITERKNYEEKIKESLKRETLLGDIIRQASVAIAIGIPMGK